MGQKDAVGAPTANAAITTDAIEAGSASAAEPARERTDVAGGEGTGINLNVRDSAVTFAAGATDTRASAAAAEARRFHDQVLDVHDDGRGDRNIADEEVGLTAGAVTAGSGFSVAVRASAAAEAIRNDIGIAIDSQRAARGSDLDRRIASVRIPAIGCARAAVAEAVCVIVGVCVRRDIDNSRDIYRSAVEDQFSIAAARIGPVG